MTNLRKVILFVFAVSTRSTPFTTPGRGSAQSASPSDRPCRSPWIPAMLTQPIESKKL